MRAVMTGRRPEQTKVFNFIDDFRSGVSTGRRGAATEHPVGANWTTMPGYFLQHGYRVYGAGKVSGLGSVCKLAMSRPRDLTNMLWFLRPTILGGPRATTANARGQSTRAVCLATTAVPTGTWYSAVART
eukprot:COSAG01_NODE_2137_length_8329_cov_52.487242_7_plen_130_part_00